MDVVVSVLENTIIQYPKIMCKVFGCFFKKECSVFNHCVLFALREPFFCSNRPFSKAEVPADSLVKRDLPF